MYRLVGKFECFDMIIWCLGVCLVWWCSIVDSSLNRLIEMVLVMIVLLGVLLISVVSLLLRWCGSVN